MDKKLFVPSLLLVIAVLMASCGPATTQAPAGTLAPATEAPPTSTATPTPPLVLKIANTANITTWDPVLSFSTEAAYMANMYEQLLRINPPDSAQKYTPLLAESWDTSTDGMTWTFHLRKGVKFHDGEPMNAAAVKKSIEAAKDHAGASFIWAPLTGVEAVDDSTVKFTLSYAAPLDLIVSSLYGAWIVSPKALDAVAANSKYYDNGVDGGTGPYTIESYTPDQQIVFSRFKDYWGGWKPGQYDKVLVNIVPEATTQEQMLSGGQVDLAERIPPQDLASFQNNPNFTVLYEPSFFNYVGFFNTLHKPLDDPKVRQALSYAIPYADIIKIGAPGPNGGLGTQSRGPVPQGVWPWSPDVKQYTTDLAKAKQLLSDAGHPNGGFKINLTYASENFSETAFAPLIKDSFAQIGVDVTLTPMEFNQQWELAKGAVAKAQDMFLLLYWPTYSDAGTDNLWSMFYGSGDKPPYLNVTNFNLSYWKNADYNKLLDDASAEEVTNAADSQAKYTQAMNLLVDQAPGVFFYDTKAAFIIPNTIAGFKYNLNYPFVPYFFYEIHTAK